MTIPSLLRLTLALSFTPSILFSTVRLPVFAADNLPAGYPQTQRSRTLLNTEWRFRLGDDMPGATEFNFDDSSWEEVSVPHTLMLASEDLNGSEDDETQPTFQREVGWYRRSLTVDARGEDRVFVEFEGVHRVTDVWVNGEHLGQHAIGGYTPFHFDITDHVKLGGQKNVLVVKADNRTNSQVPPDGNRYDYVLFGGLYRDVYLVVKPALHVTFPWEAREAGVFITTPSVTKENATVSVRTTVRNASDKSRICRLITRVVDAENRVVMRLATTAEIAARDNHTFLQTGGIDENVRLWSFDDPYLYRVNTAVEELNDAEEALSIDCVENPLGLRWFELQPGRGFCWNGVPTELIGTNRHQQHPYLGDAIPNNLHEQDAEDFKRAGFNIVRLAHYPHDNSFLSACDRLGILTCEEPPTWIEFGDEVWMDRLEQALRCTIRNHRNHPSLWSWGAGINHRGPIKRLHYAAKQEDPTRLTMSNSTLWTGPQNSGICDLYAVMDYRGATCPPGKFMIAMEHGGSLDARTNQQLVAKYRARPELLGLTIWNAHDHPTLIRDEEDRRGLAECGVWDSFRRPKPAYYWYQTELGKEPFVHIPDDRAQEKGQLTVFSNCQQVELLIDGKSLGKRPPETNPEIAAANAPPFQFPLDWTAGTLVARGYVEGKVQVKHSRSFPGKPHHVEVAFEEVDTSAFADGSSIVRATAQVCDAQGTIVPTASHSVRFRLEGPGKIVGDESIGANPIAAERGLATVLIRTATVPGQLRLFANAEGLGSSSTQQPAQLTTVATTNEMVARNARPIRELLRYQVDLGGEGQHPQDEWIAWTSSNADKALLHLNDSTSVRLTSQQGALQWETNWGVPGELSFMIEDAVAITSNDELELTISGLRAGQYTLTTWHHVLSPEQSEVPRLVFSITDAEGTSPTVLANYRPTNGRTTLITAQGGGGPGDAGHQQAAQAGAVLRFRADGKSAIVVKLHNSSPTGQVRLCGFDLQEQ